MVTPPQQEAETPKKRRVFLWVFIAVQALFVFWIFSAVSSSPNAADCQGLDTKTCNQAYDTGVGIGIIVIVFFWAAVDIILGICYLIYRATKR